MIIREWLKVVKKQFTMENIHYKRGDKFEDIDILALDIKGNFYEYELNLPFRDGPANSTRNDSSSMIDRLFNSDRLSKLAEYVKDTGSIEKNLILSKSALGSSQLLGQQEERFKSKGIKVIYFEDITAELSKLHRH